MCEEGGQETGAVVPGRAGSGLPAILDDPRGEIPYPRDRSGGGRPAGRSEAPSHLVGPEREGREDEGQKMENAAIGEQCPQHRRGRDLGRQHQEHENLFGETFTACDFVELAP